MAHEEQESNLVTVHFGRNEATTGLLLDGFSTMFTMAWFGRYNIIEIPT